MNSNSTDPREIHAVAGKLLDFLSEQTSVSLELQIAALQVAATNLNETVRVNNAQAMQAEARNFWRKR